MSDLPSKSAANADDEQACERAQQVIAEQPRRKWGCLLLVWQQVQAWLPLLVWQQVDAPQYQKCFITVTCLSVCIIITALGTRFLHKKGIRSEKEVISGEMEGSESGVETPPQQTVDVHLWGERRTFEPALDTVNRKVE